jgi:hypothetical protein
MYLPRYCAASGQESDHANNEIPNAHWLTLRLRARRLP